MPWMTKNRKYQLNLSLTEEFFFLKYILLKNDNTTFDGYLYIQWQITLQSKYIALKKNIIYSNITNSSNLLDGISNTTFHYQ